MEHMQDAYEALISKLKADLQAAYERQDENMGEHVAAENILMNFIYEKHGYKTLMKLAKEIDVELGKGVNYENFIECTYDE